MRQASRVRTTAPRRFVFLAVALFVVGQSVAEKEAQPGWIWHTDSLPVAGAASGWTVPPKIRTAPVIGRLQAVTDPPPLPAPDEG